LKNKFYFFIILYVTSSSLASRARLDALQNKNHFLDSEIIFLYPTKVSELDPFVTIESGQTAATNISTEAFTAGLFHINAESSVAIAMGRKNDVSDTERILFNVLNSESFELSQNPIQAMWSYKNKGQIFSIGFFYSHHNDKLNQISESTQVLQGGYRSGFLTVSVTVPLLNQVEMGFAKKINFFDAGSVSALYQIDNLMLSLMFENFSAQQKNLGVEASAIEFQNIQAGLTDKTDFNQNHFFYRVDVMIKNIKYKNLGTKEHENQVPLTFGIESEFNEWLTLRSSLKQTVLVSQLENISAAQNNTQAAFGMGFKFKNLTLDGTFSGLMGSAQSGALSGNQFLSEVAITSLF